VLYKSSPTINIPIEPLKFDENENVLDVVHALLSAYKTAQQAAEPSSS